MIPARHERGQLALDETLVRLARGCAKVNARAIVAGQASVEPHVSLALAGPLQGGRWPRQVRAGDLVAVYSGLQNHLGLLASRPQDRAPEALVPVIRLGLPAYVVGNGRRRREADTAPLPDRVEARRLGRLHAGRELGEQVLLLQHAVVVGADEHDAGTLGDALQQLVLLLGGQVGQLDAVEDVAVPLLLQQAGDSLMGGLAAVPPGDGGVDDAGPIDGLGFDVETLHELDGLTRVDTPAVAEKQNARLAQRIGLGPVGVGSLELHRQRVLVLELVGEERKRREESGDDGGESN